MYPDTKCDFQKANVIFTESKSNKTEQQLRSECCTGDTRILDLLPRTLWYKYLSLNEMLPMQFHESYPELSKMNPYCVAEIVHSLRNHEEIKFTLRNKEEHVHRPVTYERERQIPDRKPILDSAIDFFAQSTGKTVGVIEQPPCHPVHQMSLEQVSD